MYINSFLTTKLYVLSILNGIILYMDMELVIGARIKTLRVHTFASRRVACCIVYQSSHFFMEMSIQYTLNSDLCGTWNQDCSLEPRFLSFKNKNINEIYQADGRDGSRQMVLESACRNPSKSRNNIYRILALLSLHKIN